MVFNSFEWFLNWTEVGAILMKNIQRLSIIVIVIGGVFFLQIHFSLKIGMLVEQVNVFCAVL